MPRTRSTIEDLRRVIDCLPARTREAMLAGISANDIIVGAYSGRATGLGAAIAEHQAITRERREREAAQTGGWSFLRERRERADVERALECAERERELV